MRPEHRNGICEEGDLKATRTGMGKEPVRTFAELNAWQRARAVRKASSALVKSWPAEEKYRLTDQIVRSSRGACSNIAEGLGRFHEKDNARFCRMAKGSLTETMDHLTAAYDEGYIDANEVKEQWQLAEEALRVINGYIRYLKGMNGGTTVAEPVTEYGFHDPIFLPLPEDLDMEDPHSLQQPTSDI